MAICCHAEQYVFFLLYYWFSYVFEQMEVVNPQPIWTGFAPSPWPKYVMKRCHKEGAEEIPVPLGKVKVVEEIREMLDAQV